MFQWMGWTGMLRSARMRLHQTAEALVHLLYDAACDAGTCKVLEMGTLRTSALVTTSTAAPLMKRGGGVWPLLLKSMITSLSSPHWCSCYLLCTSPSVFPPPVCAQSRLVVMGDQFHHGHSLICKTSPCDCSGVCPNTRELVATEKPLHRCVPPRKKCGLNNYKRKEWKQLLTS